MSFVEFPKVKIIKPAALYELIFPQIDGKDILYATHTVSSAGARRIPDLETSKVIDTNSLWACHLINILVNQGDVDESQIMVPGMADVRYKLVDGQEKRWGEWDWNMFWTMPILGMTVDAADEFYEKMTFESGVDIAVYCDHDAPREQREFQYQKAIDATLKYGVVGNLAKRMLGMLDPLRSLGSWHERSIGSNYNIPYAMVKFDTSYTNFRDWIGDFPASLLLRELFNIHGFIEDNVRPNGGLKPVYVTKEV